MSVNSSFAPPSIFGTNLLLGTNLWNAKRRSLSLVFWSVVASVGVASVVADSVGCDDDDVGHGADFEDSLDDSLACMHGDEKGNEDAKINSKFNTFFRNSLSRSIESGYCARSFCPSLTNGLTRP